MDNTKFAAARRASNLSVKSAAEAVHLSQPTYIARESYPLNFRLCELQRLNMALDNTGKGILHEALGDIFLP